MPVPLLSLPALAVGWWASGSWPGATVVENREILARTADGRTVDTVAIAEFQRLSPGKTVAVVGSRGLFDPDNERVRA